MQTEDVSLGTSGQALLCWEFPLSRHTFTSKCGNSESLMPLPLSSLLQYILRLDKAQVGILVQRNLIFLLVYKSHTGPSKHWQKSNGI